MSTVGSSSGRTHRTMTTPTTTNRWHCQLGYSFNYFDSYGDGWYGGWWETLPGSVDASNAAGVVPIAGGEADGVVELDGLHHVHLGTTTSSVQGGASSSASSVTVRINNVDWANEITWNIDGGITYGVNPVTAIPKTTSLLQCLLASTLCTTSTRTAMAGTAATGRSSIRVAAFWLVAILTVW